MRKTALALALTLALTAAAPLAAAPTREARQRGTEPNPIVRAIDTITMQVKKIVKAFENPTLPHPVVKQ